MYVELHTRSAFSFLEGASLPEELVARAVELGYPALALLDRDGFYGAPRFHLAAKKAGLHAHIGAELTTHEGQRLPLLARTRHGYRNLCRLITRMKMRSRKGEGSVAFDELAEFAEGVVCLTGAHFEIAGRLAEIFGRDGVYVELQRHYDREEELRNQAAIETARRLQLPLLASNGVMHASAAGRELLDALTAIRHHVTIEKAGRLLARNNERHLKSPAEMERLFADLPVAIANTRELSARLEFTLEDLGYEFPCYPVPEGETMASFLRARTQEGMLRRYGPDHARARIQVERELTLIEKLRLEGYFLIVWDIVEFCRHEGILAQGRGSAANSAVCYSLGITAVDPVGMDLLFDRFLSEERGEWPDIDLDLPSGEQRERVIQYVYRRYGLHGAAILDVLKNYTTYATYFKLLKSCEDDPNVERKKAARALARFLKLHPHNIAQKTEVMVEHFHGVTRHKIGGRAKAMVVTCSRIEAVRYKQSFDRYIQEKGYPIRSLVAFSGTVQDDKLPDVTYSEEQMNHGIRERELPEKFASAEYQVLLVAEKYQTGFDQPLLHTMYVDKRLAGIQAVQTLSRLNRTHPLKEDTFVLDFVNDRDEIQEAFKTYYEGAEMGEEVDPARLYQIKSELDGSGIYLAEEVERFTAIYFKPKQRQSMQDHQAMNAALDPPVSRFQVLQARAEEEAEAWRGKLVAFRSLYGFLSQVIPYQDSDLERLYVFLRHLAAKLPRRKGGTPYQFDEEVRLEYYRLQKISEGSISLQAGTARALDGPAEVGSGVAREEAVPLSQLIDVVNERFGTDFNQADQLFFDQIVEVAVTDDGLRQAAAANPEDKFELVFRNLLERLFVERMDQNEEIFVRFMNDKAFQKVVTAWTAAEAYRRLRAQSPASQPTSSV